MADLVFLVDVLAGGSTYSVEVTAFNARDASNRAKRRVGYEANILTKNMTVLKCERVGEQLPLFVDVADD
jgi:hypothetical protein